MEESVQSQIFAKARAEFMRGEPVGIPTETVYGLAAPIDQELVLRRVFTKKDRPLFDPLIVHVASIEQAKPLFLEWTAAHRVLAEEFWPGPLTIVANKTAQVSDLITAGAPTVGVRMPRHALTLAFIDFIGSPLAAPSANPFSRTSPTSAQHVREYFPDLYVLDGGQGEYGIESSIVSIDGFNSESRQWEWTLLRPGWITQENISAAFNKAGIAHKFKERDKNAPISAPGSFSVHYAPDKPLMVLRYSALDALSAWKNSSGRQEAEFLKISEDPRMAARFLYAELIRAARDPQVQEIYLPWRRDWLSEHWRAVFDRVQRAATEIREID